MPKELTQEDWKVIRDCVNGYAQAGDLDASAVLKKMPKKLKEQSNG